MAALQCEICGGKLVGKPGGIFECDSCGMEYSTEWAKAKIQEIRGTVQVEGTVEVTGTVKVEGGTSRESLLRRGQLFLESGDWERAEETFDRVLDIDPECAEAYVGKLCAETGCASLADLAGWDAPFYESGNYENAVRFGGPELLAELERCKAGAIAVIQRAQEEERRKRQGEAARLRRIRERNAAARGLLSISAGLLVGVRADGTVMSVAGAPSAYQTAGWDGFAAVSGAGLFTVGLRLDGTVAAAGNNTHGQCEVSDWADIVAISTGVDHTVGLRSDGTVVAAGDNTYGQCGVSEWTDIVAVSAGDCHTVGLRADGTVVAAGDNRKGQCGVSDWREMAAVSAGSAHTIGLRADGTAAVVGKGAEETGSLRRVTGWRDLVAVSTNSFRTVGLRSDGTVVTVTHGASPKTYDVSDWSDVVAVDAAPFSVAGLRADGTVLAVGTLGRCQLTRDSVKEWKMFDSVDTLPRERAAAPELFRKRAEERRLRSERRAALEGELEAVKAELYSYKSLFAGKRRRELEARLAQIQKELEGFK